MQVLRGIIPYITLIIFLVFISIIARFLLGTIPGLQADIDFQIFVLGSVLFIGYYINRIAPKTVIPSFVWAIFAGMALQPFLAFYTQEISGLKIIMEIFAAIVLFAGGLEIPFKNFKRWFFPIASLSLIGVIISSLVFTAILYFLLKQFGEFDILLIPSIVILSAALSSTDPTAIIPTLNMMKFKRDFLKEIAISESALTDISGSILTRFLLLVMIGVGVTQSENIYSYFVPLIDKSTYDALALQIISGIIVGYIGFSLIKKFYYFSKDSDRQEADPALLISVPIFTYALGMVLGGAGFLAAFISGLLTDVVGGIKEVSHFYESLLSHLIKPFIFIVLGALVPISVLIQLAPIGILAALAFMFVIRPFVVVLSLLPWLIKHEFNLRDIFFLSFIRETGIIAAILLIIAASYDIIQSEFVIAIGMWVILLTLVLEPPLTPYLARALHVAERKK
ncbi:MAG: cation:proton antiporter [Patescibacteria group bacterium]